jgi:hypothetical protein
MEEAMTSAQQLKDWATDRMKQAKVNVGVTTASGYRSLAQKLRKLAARRRARDAQGQPRRNDPSPSSDE